MPYKFITFEGCEGAGKTTQAHLLMQKLERLHFAVHTTREPGGTSGAESIRNLLVHTPENEWSSTTELLLINAARSDHFEKVIKPKLDKGVWVICDRFIDSTFVYQTVAGNASKSLVNVLNSSIIDDMKPSLTLYLDIPVTTGLQRKMEREDQEINIFENKKTAFHEKIRKGFLDLAQTEDRIKIIDATLDIKIIEQKIWTQVQNTFHLENDPRA